MASSNDMSDAQQREEVERIMVQQADAAAAANAESPRNGSTTSTRHAGHDVPPPQRNSSLEEVASTDDLPDHPPPAYGEHFGTIQKEQDGFGTKATVADDGRVDIRINQRNRRLSQVFVPALRQQQEATDHEIPLPPPYIPPSLGGEEGVPPPPPMNVVIQVVGSRGDVQPFVALGKVLKDTYGHRVRLATHPNFKQFVTENDLEFFSIGGDPAELMAFMVKNPGLMPGFDVLRSGDVGKRRKEVGEYIKGCWRSTFESGDGTEPYVEPSSDSAPTTEGSNERPFIADVIIANPPSFAHAHIAEKLGISLHIMFTMPYSPTQAFPHPLANIQSSNADANLTNYMSYALIDMLTWQGLGDVINRFRQKSLGLEPVSLMWAPGMLQRLKIPHTYCWSPALIAKPKDWGQNISISGFFFLNLASNYTPAPDLKEFLDAGPPPVYIGFGSIVCDDPNAMTELIFEAAKITGQRVLLSKGWGGMGADELGKPDNIFMLGNVPHDWLFEHVSCVVHHGGAGTTAAGITAGKPTVVVPFFGDQPFWGAMVARAGAGPDPLPHKELTAQKLADAITFCLKPESQQRAQAMAASIAEEKGCDKGAQSFHQNLDVDKLRCTLAPSRTAVWRIKRTQVRLSALAASTLANAGLLDFHELKLYRPREYDTDDGPWDPITGASSALVGTMTQMMMGIADFPIETLKALNIHPEAAAKAKEKREKKEADELAAKEAEEGKVSPSTEQESMAGGQTEASSMMSLDSTTSNTTLSPVTSTPQSRSNSTFNVQESLDRLQSSRSSSSPRPGQSRTSSMTNALKDGMQSARKLSHSRSNSQAGSTPIGGQQSPAPQQDKQNMLDTAMGTGKGVHRILGAGFKSPMDFSYAVAKGFHNAPKLYGDDTVRKADKITDFRSGLKAAGKEFGFGLYDGITGLVSQPMAGAKKEGAAGFVKGIGKGIGGVYMKPAAGFFGIPGYAMKGVYREMQSKRGSSVQNYIIAARTTQGFEDWSNSSEAERQDVVERWKRLQKDLKKKKDPDEVVKEALDEQRMKAGAWKKGVATNIDERMQNMTRGFEDWRRRSGIGCTTGSTSTNTEATVADDPDISVPTVDSTAASTDREAADTGDSLDAAIAKSIQQTSRGDAEEDAEVERAVRASMAEVQRNRAAHEKHQLAAADEDEELRQAMEASAAEAQPSHSDPLFDEEIERALAQSLKEQRRERSSDSEWDSDDEEYQQAVEQSQQAHESNQDLPPSYESGSAHLAGTTQEEYVAQQAEQPGEKTQQEKTEEQIVMEYVKKQSLLEAEHGKGRAVASSSSAAHDDENDEDLQRALKESMRG